MTGSSTSTSSPASSRTTISLRSTASLACLTDNISIPFNLTDSWTVGGRVGYLVNANTLVYGLAGYTEAHFDLPHGAQNNTFSGWTAGAGIETSLGGPLFLKGEYRFTQLGEQTLYSGSIYVDEATVDLQGHGSARHPDWPPRARLQAEHDRLRPPEISLPQVPPLKTLKRRAKVRRFFLPPAWARPRRQTSVFPVYRRQRLSRLFMRGGVESQLCGAWRLKGEHRFSLRDKKSVPVTRAAGNALASSRAGARRRHFCRWAGSVNGRNDAVPAITDGICPKSILSNQIQLNLQPR